jgi:hypothetical protein
MLEAEQSKLVERNTYRLKVINELSEKCKSFEEQLAGLNAFYRERRSFQVSSAYVYVLT